MGYSCSTRQSTDQILPQPQHQLGHRHQPERSFQNRNSLVSLSTPPSIVYHRLGRVLVVVFHMVLVFRVFLQIGLVHIEILLQPELTLTNRDRNIFLLASRTQHSCCQINRLGHRHQPERNFQNRNSLVSLSTPPSIVYHRLEQRFPFLFPYFAQHRFGHRLQPECLLA